MLRTVPGYLALKTYMLNLYDAAATSFFIMATSPEIELNPIARMLWEYHPITFWAFKTVLPLIFIMFTYVVAVKAQSKIATRGLWIVMIAYLLLTFWHIYNFTLM